MWDKVMYGIFSSLPCSFDPLLALSAITPLFTREIIIFTFIAMTYQRSIGRSEIRVISSRVAVTPVFHRRSRTNAETLESVDRQFFGF